MSSRHSIWLLTVVAVVGLTGCGDPASGPPEGDTGTGAAAAADSEPRTFAGVRGEVVELVPEEMKARVRHEEIPDYMPAMTMPLSVRDQAELNGLTNGDAITFRLNVTEDTHWIDQVQKVAPTTTATVEDTEPNNPFTTDPNWRRVREVEPLDIGDVMPNYTFTNELGQVVQLDGLKGVPYAFTFIYTRCPIPDFCPRMSQEFLDAHDLLKNNADAPKDWRLLSITIDPQFDTVEVLKGYASRYPHDPEHWSFLRTSLLDVTAIAEQFGLMFYRPDETINHNLRTVVVDRQGRIHSIFIGNTWEAEDLVTSMLDAASLAPAGE